MCYIRLELLCLLSLRITELHASEESMCWYRAHTMASRAGRMMQLCAPMAKALPTLWVLNGARECRHLWP